MSGHRNRLSFGVFYTTLARGVQLVPLTTSDAKPFKEWVDTLVEFIVECLEINRLNRSWVATMVYRH